MFLDDGVRDRQPKAGALAHFLCREERVEDARLHVFRHTRPIVADVEHDGLALEVMPRVEDERAAAVRGDHGLLGVDDQVEEHLLHLVRIGEHLREAGGQRLDDGDVADALVVGPQRQSLANDLVEVDHRARRMPLAGEHQQIADDLRGALRLAEDRLETTARLVVHTALREPLGARQNRRERVVQLVRDTGNGLTQGGELLGLQELVIEIARLIFETLALAHISHQRFEAKAVREELGSRRDFDPNRRPVRAPQSQQVVGDGSIATQPLDEGVARLAVDETVEREWTDAPRGRIGGIPENELQIRVGGERF